MALSYFDFRTKKAQAELLESQAEQGRAEAITKRIEATKAQIFEGEELAKITREYDRLVRNENVNEQLLKTKAELVNEQLKRAMRQNKIGESTDARRISQLMKSQDYKLYRMQKEKEMLDLGLSPDLSLIHI